MSHINSRFRIEEDLFVNPPHELMRCIAPYDICNFSDIGHESSCVFATSSASSSTPSSPRRIARRSSAGSSATRAGHSYGSSRPTKSGGRACHPCRDSRSHLRVLAAVNAPSLSTLPSRHLIEQRMDAELGFRAGAHQVTGFSPLRCRSGACPMPGGGVATRAIKLHRKHIRNIKLQATSVLSDIHKGEIKIWRIRPHQIVAESLLRVDFETTAAPGQFFSRFFGLEKYNRWWDVWLKGELLVVATKNGGAVSQ